MQINIPNQSVSDILADTLVGIIQVFQQKVSEKHITFMHTESFFSQWRASHCKQERASGLCTSLHHSLLEYFGLQTFETVVTLKP